MFSHHTDSVQSVREKCQLKRGELRSGVKHLQELAGEDTRTYKHMHTRMHTHAGVAIRRTVSQALPTFFLLAGFGCLDSVSHLYLELCD